MQVKTRQIPSISKETTQRNAFQWLNIIRYRESGSIIQLQEDCDFRIDEILNNKILLKRILGPNFHDYLLAQIHLDGKNLLWEIKEKIILLCENNRFKNFQNLSNLSLTKILSKIDKTGYHIGLFITNTKQLFNNNNYAQLFELEHLLRTTRGLSVIVFTEIDITRSNFNDLADKCSSLFTHIIKYPLYLEKEANQFINYNLKLWNMKLSIRLRKEIVDQCGGYLWLIRQALRIVRDNPKAGFADIFSHQLMVKKIEVIWEKFTADEKKLLKAAANSVLTADDKLTAQYHYLKTINVLKEKQGSVSLGIPLLAQVIQKEIKANEIYLQGEKVFSDGKDLTYHLTPNEIKLLRLLLKNKGSLVARDIIAQALWEDSWEDKYSDWAIDKLINRLRSKLLQLEIDKQRLKTVKRKGIIFQ